ncbi:MAG: DUF4160 domain-containing protein [Candidatus Eremiobacteraeota bacterium]|nr:DUF4160 domain-containing protein [Candidatus Eremiobacteraeota bacterium]
MPEISRFYGIVIRMFYEDHNPPHFHAIYGKQEAMISISELRILEGRISKRALLMTLEWAIQYREALMESWQLAMNSQPLKSIPPLK